MGRLAITETGKIPPRQSKPGLEVRSMCTVYVCTSCRHPGTAREPKENRPGFKLYQKLREALASIDLSDCVEVKAAGCLSICPRPCGIALSMPESWTYLFGDQDPDETAHDVMECVSLYLESPNGFMPRDKRPEPLRGSILGRVPPLQGGRSCT